MTVAKGIRSEIEKPAASQITIHFQLLQLLFWLQFQKKSFRQGLSKSKWNRPLFGFICFKDAYKGKNFI